MRLGLVIMADCAMAGAAAIVAQKHQVGPGRKLHIFHSVGPPVLAASRLSGRLVPLLNCPRRAKM